MDQMYALGISCIECIQYWCSGFSGYLEIVNHLANPKYILEIFFPLVSVVDSVFAAQLLLCLSFGGWLNGVLKWWFLEDRPYWWVQKTTFYRNDRPHLLQTAQTCETGPGSPSGHTVTAASVTILVIMWISHVINDWKWEIWWWKHVASVMFAFVLGSVMLARMYVATHFPHQCLFGALIGLIMAPALCIYVTDPFVWRYGSHVSVSPRAALCGHVALALAAIAFTAILYFALCFCGIDPQFSVDLAYQMCESPENIHVSTTPLFALAQCTANLLGWALFVSPDVAEYRHFTKNRSLIISLFSATILMFLFKQMEEIIPKDNNMIFYPLQFILNVLRPALFIRVVPMLSTWAYSSNTKTKTK